MGLLTLAEFREEVTSVLGSRPDVDDRRIDRWINIAYKDVVGAVEFEELDQIIEIGSHLDGFDIPEGVIVVRGLISPNGLVQWVPQLEFIRLHGNVPGDFVQYWTRIGNRILLSPVVPDEEALSILAKIDPAELEAEEDVTAIPRSWDAAILYLAISHGYFSLDSKEDGISWFNRGLSYIQAMAKNERRNLFRPGLGATLAPTLETLSELSNGNA